MGTSAEEFIATKRALLNRLERFALTSRYQRLQATIGDVASDLPEAWLAEWLVSPALGLDGLPIDIAYEPGGLDLLQSHLRRIALNAGA